MFAAEKAVCMLLCLNDAFLANESSCSWFSRVNNTYHDQKKHIFPVLLRSADMTNFSDGEG